MNQPLIPQPVVLTGERVVLRPLETAHFEGLLSIGVDARIWEFISINGADPVRLTTHLKSALLKRATGEQYPFTVFDKQTGAIIGATMYHNIFPEHRKLEIGWTWYRPDYWRTGTNRECKLLLLTHCFEALGLARVQLVTDERNVRSRTAILGIGATFEGVLRKERIKADGHFRNTAMYSILDDEWPAIKERLSRQLYGGER